VKTAISIPDGVFEEAERLAKNRGLSRSELYTRAITEYLNGNRFLGVREGLDAVYASDPAQSDLAPMLASLQSASLPRDDW
jgi:metal-responsive CopG/Arc/MetJ family transcriptional regulator